MNSDYLSKDIGLGIQGVAIKSGALKKHEEDREIFMDVMNRSMPPGIEATVKYRGEMPSGFRIGQREPPSSINIHTGRMGDGQSLLNSLSKAEVYARMGIDPSKELEIDWEQVDSQGNAKDRIELADKMFGVLQREKQKVEYKMNLLNQRLHGDEDQQHHETAGSPLTTQIVSQSGMDNSKGSRPATGTSLNNARNKRPGTIGSGKKPKSNNRSQFNGEVSMKSGNEKDMFNDMPHGEQPWTHLGPARADYANNYGFRPSRLPYEDEVDMMHEERDRYQEVNHWYSTLEKPSEDNVDVLKQINHDRLQQLGVLYQQKKAQEAAWMENQEASQHVSPIPKSRVEVLHRSNKEINQEKIEYKDKFKRYLHNKNKMKEERERSYSPPSGEGVDFDRYQCTSPNPKYVIKNNSVPYRDNMYLPY